MQCLSSAMGTVGAISMFGKLQLTTHILPYTALDVDLNTDWS